MRFFTWRVPLSRDDLDPRKVPSLQVRSTLHVSDHLPDALPRSGSGDALLRPRPLRTVLAPSSAHGSSGPMAAQFGAILPVTGVHLPVAQGVYDFQIVEVVASTPAAVLQMVHVNSPV